MIQDILEKGFYRHYKGSLYYVDGVAINSETMEDMVIYHDANDKTWVRPFKMFLEFVEVDGKKVQRFTKLTLAEADIELKKV